MLPVSYLLDRERRCRLRCLDDRRRSRLARRPRDQGGRRRAEVGVPRERRERRALRLNRPMALLAHTPTTSARSSCWWGVFLYAVPFLHGAAFAVVIGPVFITLLLLFVSGIPLLERSADKKYGDDAAYREYKRRTSVLVPLPPARLNASTRRKRSRDDEHVVGDHPARPERLVRRAPVLDGGEASPSSRANARSTSPARSTRSSTVSTTATGSSS